MQAADFQTHQTSIAKFVKQFGRSHAHNFVVGACLIVQPATQHLLWSQYLYFADEEDSTNPYSEALIVYRSFSLAQFEDEDRDAVISALNFEGFMQ